eukprot:CAMPEP_0174352262 /NCGR_PEP_ID=MMETSP0811_2-20130205/9881_1 /TAXON_ID=73025 ORGANISM="Eutreptiella gymnastica-like, Strain CCMP1594" /NCGR_SAMPLE_ID=MMETSP0811_2 /ASSEMBLY_ACC=CAM_ASM_000667 /LENGTH=36 /DNA_ID= /DNA_START= /DNA_END= /DNA_ORIENTATION=
MAYIATGPFVRGVQGGLAHASNPQHVDPPNAPLQTV